MNGMRPPRGPLNTYAKWMLLGFMIAAGFGIIVSIFNR